jgi:hypothetical protein
MPPFEEKIQNHLDDRARTLARIKTRSVDADTLTLTALSVLVYAQLEGGVKDLASCVLEDLNSLRPRLGNIRPRLLSWRNPEHVDELKKAVDFEVMALSFPFGGLLTAPFQLKPINRRYEMNRMDWKAIGTVYTGLGLDHGEIDKLKAKIDQIVEDRNEVAHYGTLPTIAASYMEQQVREKVDVVENVLTDLCLQLLPFFTDRMHTR